MTYQEALAEARSQGLARCSDQAAMASFCDGCIQILVGAVSPRLVWEGAVTKGLTLTQLAELVHRAPIEVGELQWLPTTTTKEKK